MSLDFGFPCIINSQNHNLALLSLQQFFVLSGGGESTHVHVLHASGSKMPMLGILIKDTPPNFLRQGHSMNLAYTDRLH